MEWRPATARGGGAATGGGVRKHSATVRTSRAATRWDGLSPCALTGNERNELFFQSECHSRAVVLLPPVPGGPASGSPYVSDSRLMRPLSIFAAPDGIIADAESPMPAAAGRGPQSTKGRVCRRAPVQIGRRYHGTRVGK